MTDELLRTQCLLDMAIQDRDAHYNHVKRLLEENAALKETLEYYRSIASV